MSLEYTALLIHPDKVQRATLKGYLEILVRLRFMEFDNDVSALDWLKCAKDKVDFIFLGWELHREGQNVVGLLREQTVASSALIFMIASPGDHEWIKTIFSMGDLIDNILIKPFRPQVFIQKVQTLLKSNLTKKSCVLLVEDDPGAREVLKDYLINFGFSKVYEASDGEKGFDLLHEKADEVAIVVSDWEMPSMNGIQLLKKIRQTPKFSSIPFVMVTSQTSIEQIKAVQAADNEVNGYLLKPFDLKTFRSQMDSVFKDVARQKQGNVHLIEGKTFLAQGHLHQAIEILTEGTRALPEVSALFEALGDAYCMLSAKSNQQRALSQACESYEKALKLAPSKTPLVMKCFEVYMALGRMNNVIYLLKNHLKRSGFDDDLRTRLGKIYLKSGDYGAACVELRRALNINPGNTEAQSLYQIAMSLNQKGEVKETG